MEITVYTVQATYLRHEVVILLTVHIKWQGWLIVWNSFLYLRRFLILQVTETQRDIREITPSSSHLSYIFFWIQLNNLNPRSYILQALQTSDHPQSFCLCVLFSNTWFLAANTGTILCILYENSAMTCKTASIPPYF